MADYLAVRQRHLFDRSVAGRAQPLDEAGFGGLRERCFDDPRDRFRIGRDGRAQRPPGCLSNPC